DLLQVFESSQRREVGELGSAHDETPEVRGCPKGGEILEGCGLDLQGLQLSQILFSREPGKRIALESHVLQTTQTNGLRRVEVGAVATFQITCIDIKPLSARGHRLGAMDGKRGLFGGGALRSIIGQSAEDLLQSALDDQRSTETLRHDSAVDQTTVGGARVGALRAEELQLTRRVLDDCPSPLREDLRDLFASEVIEGGPYSHDSRVDFQGRRLCATLELDVRDGLGSGNRVPRHRSRYAGDVAVRHFLEIRILYGDEFVAGEGQSELIPDISELSCLSEGFERVDDDTTSLGRGQALAVAGEGEVLRELQRYRRRGEGIHVDEERAVRRPSGSYDQRGSARGCRHARGAVPVERIGLAGGRRIEPDALLHPAGVGREGQEVSGNRQDPRQLTCFIEQRPGDLRPVPLPVQELGGPL